MRDPSLDVARVIIARAGEMTSGDALRCLLDHYLNSAQPARDAFVGALIGDLVAAQQLRAFRHRRSAAEVAA